MEFGKVGSAEMRMVSILLSLGISCRLRLIPDSFHCFYTTVPLEKKFQDQINIECYGMRLFYEHKNVEPEDM